MLANFAAFADPGHFSCVRLPRAMPAAAIRELYARFRAPKGAFFCPPFAWVSNVFWMILPARRWQSALSVQHVVVVRRCARSVCGGCVIV